VSIRYVFKMTHSITSDINLNKTILIEVLLKRKPILLIDEKVESKQAIEFLINNHIEYVVLNLKKFEESCCAELPTTRAPSLFAPEDIFKDLEGIMKYVSLDKQDYSLVSESAYW
jgi:hypothetical protein